MPKSRSSASGFYQLTTSTAASKRCIYTTRAAKIHLTSRPTAGEGTTESHANDMGQDRSHIRRSCPPDIKRVRRPEPETKPKDHNL